jgi:hypothetical protein
MEGATAEAHRSLVTVAVAITDEAEATIESGTTEVTALKAEFGAPPESVLWVIARDGTKKQLGDHESYDVKEGDRFEAIFRGGVS